MRTRNITLSMSEELVRQAKVAAAQRDMSVSALVARLLEQLVGEVRDDEQVWADERRLMDEGIGMQVGDVAWTRDELHER
jgi:hypothetical protein